MIKSKVFENENMLNEFVHVKPELKLNREPQPIVSTSSPDIGNTNVVYQGGFTDAEIEEMAIKEIVYNDVKRAWWIEGAKYINNKIYKNGKTKS